MKERRGCHGTWFGSRALWLDGFVECRLEVLQRHLHLERFRLLLRFADGVVLARLRNSRFSFFLSRYEPILGDTPIIP